MRIAVPTDDGTSVSAHFGRSAAFLIFEVQDGQIKTRETRANNSGHSHAPESCGAHSGSTLHSHAGFVAALAGCDAVVCGGMGWRAAEALKDAGITVVVAPGPAPAEDLVKAYLNGALERAQKGFCGCSH